MWAFGREPFFFGEGEKHFGFGVVGGCITDLGACGDCDGHLSSFFLIGRVIIIIEFFMEELGKF
jgi:hypothetical protein